MVILRQQPDSRFDETMRSLARGEFAQKCFRKIEQMKGTIIGVDFGRGQWPGTGETFYFVCEETPHLFAALCTDDSCVSFMALGNRIHGGQDRLLERLLQEIEQPRPLAIAS